MATTTSATNSLSTKSPTISSKGQGPQSAASSHPVPTNTIRPTEASNSNSDIRDEHLLEETNNNCNPSFHIANIKNLISKTVYGENLPFLKAQEKISFLREQCKEETPYFLAFAETYLKSGIKEAEYQIEGYSHETGHRQNRDGGGVIIYINNNLTYETLISASDEMCSIVGVYINEIKLIVLMVYRPPPNYKNKYHGKLLEKSFENIVVSNVYKVMKKYKSQIPDVILTGDYNFPKAIWSNGIGRSHAESISSTRSLQKLIDLAADLDLIQIVSEGTRETRKGNRNILELIFTNNHELVSNIYIEPSKITDHKYIICETTYKYSLNQPSQADIQDINLSSYNYLKADWVTIKAKLTEIKWEEILGKYKTLEEKLEIILEFVISIVDEHCEKFKQRMANRKNIPRDRRTLHRKKKKIKKRLKEKHLSTDKKFKFEKSIEAIDQKLLDSLSHQRNEEEARAIENIKTKPKHFFAYAKKHIKTKSTIGPFKMDDELITDLNEISDKLLDQYSSTFSVPNKDFGISDPSEFFCENELSSSPNLVDFSFSKEDIVNQISNIKNDSAAGPDYFPAVLLKECAVQLSEPLYILWRHSLDNGDIAPSLKKAVVCPIHKPGSQRSHPMSYRPVSLTSHIIKCFERVVRSKIVKFLQENNRLPKDQHGFICGRSTLSQLLNYVEELIRAWEEGKVTDTVYLDFAKAFDKVDHNILCHKIKQLGITGKVGLWIKDFLTGRTQRVTANGVLSNLAPVISGVPQGSVIGPILFIIMISDLGKELIHSITSKYADDTKATAKISNIIDAINFQYELDEKVYPWAPANNMQLNGSKFEHLQVGKNLNPVNYIYTDPSGNLIQEKDHIKDLGVYISNTLTWKNQIENVVSKARVMVGWVLRTFSTRAKEPMLIIWNSQVRPVLDYCSPLWSPGPWNYKEIDLIERTQRVFTRRIEGMEELDYGQRLKALNLYSIQRRHERYKVIYVYKIKEGLVQNISEDNGLKFTYHGRHGCRCEIPIYPLYNNRAGKARENSFALTACNLWNALPRHIRNISGKSIDGFKRHLDKTLKLYPDVPRCSSTGRFKDKHGRNSNSLYDLYKDSEVRKLVNQSEDISKGGPPGWPGSN